MTLKPVIDVAHLPLGRETWGRARHSTAQLTGSPRFFPSARGRRISLLPSALLFLLFMRGILQEAKIDGLRELKTRDTTRRFDFEEEWKSQEKNEVFTTEVWCE